MAACAAASLAQSQISLIVASDGFGQQIGTTVFVEEGVFGQVGGPSSFDDLSYSFDATTGMGSGAYFGTGGNSMDFSLAVDLTSEKFVPPYVGSVDGTWTYTGGTGSWAGLAGQGTMSLTFLGSDPIGPGSAYTASSFAGILTPEPAPFAALGLGMLGLLIRRRKNAK